MQTTAGPGLSGRLGNLEQTAVLVPLDARQLRAVSAAPSGKYNLADVLGRAAWSPSQVALFVVLFVRWPG
jgi:hypothetical protein